MDVVEHRCLGQRRGRLAFNKTQTLYSQAAHDVCSAGAQLEWAIGE